MAFFDHPFMDEGLDMYQPDMLDGAPRNPHFLRHALKKVGGMSCFRYGDHVSVAYTPTLVPVSFRPSDESPETLIKIDHLVFRLETLRLRTGEEYAYVHCEDILVVEPFRFHGHDHLGTVTI